MKELKILATHAARYRIRGRSYKRNSLLKPLDIILAELERCPNTLDENEIEFAKTSSKGLISEHVKRVARGVHTEDIYQYVEIFFQEVLDQAHDKNVNKLLQRERSLRSAYIVYLREALAELFLAQGKAKSIDEAQEELDKTEQEDGNSQEEAEA